MATNLVQILSNKDRYIIYYDADVFNEDVTISVHLTVPNISNTSGHVTFSNTSAEEWNTIYEEEFGTSGQSNKLYQIVSGIPQYIVQELSDIAVQIWALPAFTNINGPGSVNINSSHIFSLNDEYDPGNIYTYKWRLRKINQTDTDTANGRALITSINTGRTVELTFIQNGFVNLECLVIGPTGCPRIIRKQICVELPLTKMLIVRNRLV